MVFLNILKYTLKRAESFVFLAYNDVSFGDLGDRCFGD